MRKYTINLSERVSREIDIFRERFGGIPEEEVIRRALSMIQLSNNLYFRNRSLGVTDLDMRSKNKIIYQLIEV